MIRLLGRATSGNVQKVIFLLEEMRIALSTPGLRAVQFNNMGGDYLNSIRPERCRL